MRISAALLLFAWAAVSADTERRNPFAHTLESAADGGTAATPDQLDEEELVVSAILVAGGQSLVNINGSVIGVGEESFGYRLVAVSEESATFVHDEETVTVSLFDQQSRRRRD